MPSMPHRAVEDLQHFSLATVDQSVEAIEIMSAAIRQSMRCAGLDQAAIDVEAKRHHRLIDRLRAGRLGRIEDVRFVAAALQLTAGLHDYLCLRHAGASTSRTIERAAGEIAQRRPAGARWPIGTQLVEMRTGAVWWVDELASGRRDLVGVIPDEGAPNVVWRLRSEFVPYVLRR